MATNTNVESLRMKGTTISYPFINQDASQESQNRILVNITEEKSQTDTVTLYYAYANYFPKIHRYLKKRKKCPLNDEIVKYVDQHIETPIIFKYEIGTWGYITNSDTMELSFGKINDHCEYTTEIFLLHDSLQKYEFEHYDITSKTPKKMTKNVLPEPIGWITESIFTPIPIPYEYYDDDNTPIFIQFILQWKCCREDYLEKKLAQQKEQLTNKIKDRGILFRQTYKQWHEPVMKAFRGKICTNNVSKTVEVKYNTPYNLFHFKQKPDIEKLFGYDDDESLKFEANVCCIELEMMELMRMIGWQYLIKFYDENAQAFKIDNKIHLDMDSYETFDLFIDEVIKIINEKASNRYEKLTKNTNNKYLIKRKVKYFITVNGTEMSYNRKSGKSSYLSNVYKTLKLRNGESIVSGKIE